MPGGYRLPMSETTDSPRTGLGPAAGAITGSIAESITEKVAEIKPKLRGWLHLATAPLVLAAGIVLIALSPNARAVLGASIYTAAALLLFTVSAVYHRGNGHWSPRVYNLLKRWDHANIMVMIAGSYTPFALLLLNGTSRWVLLTLVWAGAIGGVFFRVFWNSAPRWLYVPIYLALGWAAIFFIPSFLSGAEALGAGVGIAVFTLICVGGALYTFGGVVYGFKRPNPWPRVFGFHEVFHAFTILAFAAHYAGVSLATYSLR